MIATMHIKATFISQGSMGYGQMQKPLSMTLEEMDGKLLLYFTGAPTEASYYADDAFLERLYTGWSEGKEDFALCDGGMGYERCIVKIADMICFLMKYHDAIL